MRVSIAPVRVRRRVALASLAIAVVGFHQAARADGEDPALAAFGNTANFAFSPGTFTVTAPLTQVPAGKRYVIELLSLSCRMSGGQFISSAILTVGQKLPGGAVSTQGFPILLQHQGPDDDADQTNHEHYVGTLAARVYADDIAGSPSDVLLHVTRTGALTPAGCTASFSGYLVNLRGDGRD